MAVDETKLSTHKTIHVPLHHMLHKNLSPIELGEVGRTGLGLALDRVAKRSIEEGWEDIWRRLVEPYSCELKQRSKRCSRLKPNVSRAIELHSYLRINFRGSKMCSICSTKSRRLALLDF